MIGRASNGPGIEDGATPKTRDADRARGAGAVGVVSFDGEDRGEATQAAFRHRRRQATERPASVARPDITRLAGSGTTGCGVIVPFRAEKM